MVNTDRFNRAIFPDLAMKAPAILASTGNLTLSGEQTIDGSTTSETRVLVKDQTNAWENGLYRTGTGSWSRENDFNGNRSALKGTTVLVTNGTLSQGKYFQVSSTGSVTGGYHAITGSSTGDTVSLSVADLFAAQQLFGTLWNFDSSTTMADPGTADIRFDNATLSSVTNIAISATSAAGLALRDWIATWDDSTMTTMRGTLRIQESGTANFVILTVSGAITDNTTWLQIPVTYVTHSGSFAAGDDLIVQFSRTGDTGSLDINGLTENSALNPADYVPVYSSTAAANRKVAGAAFAGASPAVYSRSTDFTYASTDKNALYAVSPTSSAVVGTLGAGSSAGVLVKIVNDTDGKDVTFAPPSTAVLINGSTAAYRVPGRSSVGLTALSTAAWLVTEAPPHKVGDIIANPSSALADASWVWPDGTGSSRVSYAGLFAICSTRFGATSTDTFVKPDLRERVLAGWGAMGGSTSPERLTNGVSGVSGSTIGAFGGNEGVTLTNAQMPAHTHAVSARAEAVTNTNIAAGTDGAVQGTFNTNSTGGGGAHPNVQPTFILPFAMKA
jgi:microcystin-dependent protein